MHHATGREMMRSPFSTKVEISSTAKLLDVIRGEGASASSPTDPLAYPSPSGGELVRELLQHLPFFRKRLVVGIEIGPNYLALVKMLPLSPARHKLLDHRLVPFEPKSAVGSPSFYEFLRSVVLDFSGSLKQVSLWTSLSPSHGDLRQIRIPRKAARRELAHAVYWVARKEMKFDEAEVFFDFEVQGEVTDERDGKIWVMAYIAPRDAMKKVKELFAKSGLELAGLTIAPFIVQNLFRSQWVPTSSITTYADLQFGYDTSRISIFFKGNLILTKVSDVGTDQLVPSTDTDPADEEGLLEQISPALEKLTEEIETVFHYHCGPGKGEPIQKLFVSGPVIPGKALINHLSQNLGVRMVTVDLLNPANPFLSRVRPPPSRAERARYTPALGLALSANTRTPNMLCPFAAKARQAAVTRLNRVLLWAFGAVFFILGGLFLWQDHARNQKSAELTRLQEELAQLTPVANAGLVTELASKVKAQQRLLKSKAEKYLSLAVLSELSGLTPDTIRLLSITADFGGLPEAATRDLGGGQIKSLSRSLILEGIVEGDSLTAEASLAHYLMRLGASPLFVDPAVHQSALEISQEVGEVLHFFLRMGLGQGG